MASATRCCVCLDTAPHRASEPTEAVYVLPANATSVAMALEVRDDYAVAQATLHLTLAPWQWRKRALLRP